MTTLAPVVEEKATYEVGDVVLVDALEEDEKYRMYTHPEVSATYVEGMAFRQLATVTELITHEGMVIGYRLDEGGQSFGYTDEMIFGKIIEIDDVDGLEEDDVLLITSDETTGVNPNILGKLATFKGVAKRKGEEGEGFFSILDLDDELLFIDVDGMKLTIATNHLEGVVYNPFLHFCSLMEELEDCCQLIKDEVGEDGLEAIIDEILPIAIMETLSDDNVDDEVLENIIRAIFGNEIEEGIEDDDFAPCECCSADYDVEEYDDNPTLMQYNIVIDKVVYSDPATIMFYTTGAYDEDGNFYVPEDSKQRKVVAKAKGEDVYDKEKGYQICVYKMFNRESARRLKELYK